MSEVKEGKKTSEFKMSYIAIILSSLVAGVFEMGLPEAHWAVKVATILSPILVALGYNHSRGMAKSVKMLAIVALPLFLVGGCCKGHVRADSVDGLVNKVSDRHDVLVREKKDLNGDGKVDEKDERERVIYLRSTSLLRQVFKEAQE